MRGIGGAHGETQQDLVGGLRGHGDVDHDLAAIHRPESEADEIRHCAPESPGIAQQRVGHISGDVRPEAYAPSRRAAGQQPERVLEACPEAEWPAE
jgi:hypothetical protein